VIVDVQLNPAVEPWERLRDGVVVAEAAGFGTAWVFDHFDGSMLRGSDTMLECFSLLGALAGATTRIALGSLVVNVANRPVGVMAGAAATVQTVSGGRFVLGLGAGAAPGTRWSAEHRRFGIGLGATMAGRRERLAAALDTLDELWSDDRAPDDQHYPLPRPHRPPVILGVNSEPLARLAGLRTDGVNVRSTHESLEPLLAAAFTGRAERGLDTAGFDVSVWAEFDPALCDPDHPDRRRWAALGVTRLVLVCLTPHDPNTLAACLR
jgi:alkanesulfonate monooxygenase SsuD/methylene tetrahydromethanopterin reductase-like flavin-dependent oxidoreductase (luciferase family)